MFTHENFKPYQLSIEFMSVVMTLLEKIVKILTVVCGESAR